jgi:periplasmic divalent cation tolerance protein
VTDESDTLVVLTTLPSDGEAQALVRRLVEDRLVACGSVLGPVSSVYRWEGRVEEASETQVLLKTRRGRWPALLAAVEALHPYDVPELLAVPVALGLPAYVDWIGNETAEEGR